VKYEDPAYTEHGFTYVVWKLLFQQLQYPRTYSVRKRRQNEKLLLGLL